MILSISTLLILHFGHTHACMATRNSATTAVTVSCENPTIQPAVVDTVDGPTLALSGTALTVTCSTSLENVTPIVTYNGAIATTESIMRLSCVDDAWRFTTTDSVVTVTSVGCNQS